MAVLTAVILPAHGTHLFVSQVPGLRTEQAENDMQDSLHPYYKATLILSSEVKRVSYSCGASRIA